MTQFDAARRGALMRDIITHITRRPRDLLSFERVRERLRLKRIVDRGVMEVPLDQVVGTLGRGREHEFNRAFLPRAEALRERWEDVRELAEGPKGFSAVELYRVGEAYFVVDGHHRVSVARSMKAPAIEAHVKEFLTPVPLAPDASIEEVLMKEGLADFLEATGLVPVDPDDYRVTEPNGYERLLDHISVHRYLLGVDMGRAIGWDEAVASWRDTLYRPVVGTIRETGVLEEFPKRTEADLYLFVMDRLHDLKQRYGSHAVSISAAVVEFTLMQTTAERVIERIRNLWQRVTRQGRRHRKSCG
ncbi:MAG: hypothetical protein AB1714_30185 [Acidobacteriota bacterium]